MLHFRENKIRRFYRAQICEFLTNFLENET